MSTTTGQQLKSLRESKGISLEQASRETCLLVATLDAFEQDKPADDLPEVYQRLSRQMYARYLGAPVETVRRVEREPAASMRFAPLNIILRRIGGPALPERQAKRQKSALFALAKTTSVAVVTILAIGLWSLNAKLSRVNFDRVLDVSIERATSLDEPSAQALEEPEAAFVPVPIEVSLDLREGTPLFLGEATPPPVEFSSLNTDAVVR